MRRRWRAGGDVRLSPVSHHRYVEGAPAIQLADVVAFGDVGEQGSPVDPLSTRRGYNKGDGCRVDVQARAGRHARTHPARLGWAGNTSGWNVVSYVCDRSDIRAWNRIAHTGGTRGR